MESDQQQEEEKRKGKQPENNEQSHVEPKEEEEEKKAGDGSGSNLEVKIHMAINNLDHGMDVRYIDSESYLNHVRRDIDIDAQIQLLRAIGDYCERNGHSPYRDKDTLHEFITNELQLVDASPEGCFTERIEHMQNTYRRLRTIVNAKGPSCLVGPEVEMVRLEDKVLWGIELNDLPSNSEVVDGFGGNLDGAEDARDVEEEEGESNRLDDGFGGNLGGANQDARGDLDEDFRDDPNFSIDVEEFLMKSEEEETRRQM